MTKIVLILTCILWMSNPAHAATWVTIHESVTAKLLVDKQSIMPKDDLKKVWVKIEYKVPQKNVELVEKEFNSSKLLWFFDCQTQKAATSQVIQYFNDQIVYSAAIDSKNAEFVEPIPDTEVDITMHYVCEKSTVVAKKASSENNKPADTTKAESKPETKSDAKADAKPSENKATEAKPADTKASPAKQEAKADAKSEASKPESQKPAAATAKVEPSKELENKKGVTPPNKTHWTYEGNEGPENWGKLSPEFAMCDIGRNQSPINIDNTIHAILKPLKTLQKFPAKEIFNNGHTVQVNFKEGNMMVLDSAPYQMKQVYFHSPSENTIHGETYPLEAHFVHADSNGNLTVIGVMFKEGVANKALSNLWTQLPATEGPPVPIKARVLPSELIPQNPTYFRFSGSLTTPPCSEGVRWILMKTPMTASKEQIEAFKKVIHEKNNRPVQALNGRAVLE